MYIIHQCIFATVVTGGIPPGLNVTEEFGLLCEGGGVEMV